MIVLHFDEPTPSINLLLGQRWQIRHRERMKWHWLTKAALRRAQIWVPPKWPKARIRIERYGSRMLDADNFRAGTKFLVDSLVHEGIITDDKPSVIGEPELTQHAGKERRTVVTIEALPFHTVSRETK
jgi:hypothetical protein